MKQVLRGEVFRDRNEKEYHLLTKREVEILKLLASGYNNPKIAEKLHISRSTVETHRKHLNRKLNIKSYTRLMKYALAFDLVRF
jgi:DNA-binding NarL/FixJ family response regulator